MFFLAVLKIKIRERGESFMYDMYCIDGQYYDYIGDDGKFAKLENRSTGTQIYMKIEDLWEYEC